MTLSSPLTALLVGLVACSGLQLAASSSSSSGGLAVDALWPVPQQVACTGASSGGIHVAAAFTISSSAADAVIASMAARYQALIRSQAAHRGRAPAAAPSISSATVALGHGMPAGGYRIEYSAGAAVSLQVADAPAAGYALETLAQLLAGGVLNCSALVVSDAPALPHRGLMLDVASRYYPVALLQRIIDAMAALKLNVLNLHMADYGGVRVVSGKYTEVTDKTNGVYPQVYGQ